ncbi:glycine cleavage system aminomethyltransferase GcvT [Anoxybacillus sp. LAT_35]|uniref:glycine cleavage system aminomethyltransferase GcvT n=1 Tax=Anoxybacillus TaxID=150247 RepID=UPI001ED9C911|nr:MULTISPECIES: glycine cleavage system aminomethyltransferase GcvT [Anoxybacillus]MCG5024301.1 glycine cleavage system aminomethyltransferase GcvT [Anoxybacillus flavithermus]MCG6198317.1 glycine cleavage system aminomethyltransferase GcvT [Anoxybacillus sp. LAT_38]MCG3085747.1 glycine cleavage system aminomethyltransferase GcvT [Anoxybacillus sp. LAT27]MCG6171929.1 glycine cleavage system aminomethyltransferase GcvT [Anoxybacillus sp. LAT_11]MCG6174271.1 glycine cleavage system aminomethylt
MLQRTPLFPLYAEYGAKTIDFGGWELPVQFSSIKEEHEAVRTRAGLFDVSHMGEFEVKGKDSLAFLQKMMTNDVAKLTDGRAQYTLMCYEDGGTVDDLLVYKKADDHYLLVVNAANIEKDFAWLSEHVVGDVELVNISNDIAQLALQGPLAEKVLQQLTTVDLSTMKFFAFADHVDVAGVQTLVSRTGYTGEDGFELYCRAEDAPTLWRAILEAGKEEGVLPCGLGARDTLRFEACLPLYGQELAKDITPIEAGLGFAVKTNKDVDFFGKEVLKKQKEEGTPRRLVGIEMIDKGIARHGYAVYVNNEQIGFVTTGTQSPTLKKNIGLALISTAFSALDTEVEVDVRGKRLKARVVATPFYKRTK